jgi:hypothetical protein
LYALKTIDKIQPVKKFQVPAKIIIGIGPVSVPEYLDRPQIVTKNADKTLTVAQFDRWGDPLNLAMARVISENLRVQLPAAVIETYPWNSAVPVKYRVLIDVIQLVCELNKNMSLVVQWSVIEVKNNKMMLVKKMEITEPIRPNDYSGLVKALSLGCASLSKQIAGGIASVAHKPETEENISGAAQ